jgi:hypothetical protein
VFRFSSRCPGVGQEELPFTPTALFSVLMEQIGTDFVLSSGQKIASINLGDVPCHSQ